MSRQDLPWIVVALAGLCLAGIAGTASAQVAAGKFASSARSYLNTPTGVRGLFCYSAAKGYECRGADPLLVVLESMPAGPAKKAMDEGCGELDGIELSPARRFTLQLVPTEVAARDGEYTRGGRSVRGRLTVVTATVISAKRE